MNADGSLDSFFALGSTANQVTVQTILPQTNRKILVGGIFDTYNDIPRMALLRLNTQNKTSDFDSDAKTDVAVFRPSNRNWFFRNSSNNLFSGINWGLSNDKLTPADFDGDGKTDLAVWREDAANPNLSYFYILQSSNNAVRIEQFGSFGDDPSIVGDFDGDGRADPAVYRNAAVGSQSFFYFRGSLNNPLGNITFLPWGTNGDKAVRGDFDGDELQDAAVFRPLNGTWFVLRSSDNLLQTQQFGLSSDKLVANDYDGDGKTDVAVFRPALGIWFVLRSVSNSLQIENWGLATDALVPADYDGDGRTDFAVYRNGIWFLKQSTNGILYDYFGLASDIPILFAN